MKTHWSNWDVSDNNRFYSFLYRPSLFNIAINLSQKRRKSTSHAMHWPRKKKKILMRGTGNAVKKSPRAVPRTRMLKKCEMSGVPYRYRPWQPSFFLLICFSVNFFTSAILSGPMGLYSTKHDPATRYCITGNSSWTWDFLFLVPKLGGPLN